MEWNIERKREYKARARETETIECEMIGEDKGSKEKEEVWEGVWATLLTVFVMRQDWKGDKLTTKSLLLLFRHSFTFSAANPPTFLFLNFFLLFSFPEILWTPIGRLQANKTSTSYCNTLFGKFVGDYFNKFLSKIWF